MSRNEAPPLGSAGVYFPRRWMILLALLPLLPLPAGAQREPRFEVDVRILSEAGGVIDGAVVRLVDSDGRPRSVGRTNTQGRATLVVPEPGSYRFAVDRMGFAFWESGLRALRPPAEEIELVVPLAPVSLGGLEVFVEGRCSPQRPILVRVLRTLVRRPSSAMTHEERVRLATVRERTMLALSEVVLDRPGVAGWEVLVTEERPRTVLDDLLLRPTGVISDTARVRGTAPYEVPPVEFLASHGYVEPLIPPDQPAVYHPLTPEAVVSEGFARTHCFQVADHPGNSWVGLAFEPVPGHPNTDVRGVVWMDSLSWRPQEIEYEYTRLAESFVESGEWAVAIRQARIRRGRFLVEERREVVARAPRRNITGRGVRSMPTPNEREFGGRIEFGYSPDDRWDVVRSEHYWPSLLGRVHVEPGAIVTTATGNRALEAVTVESARVLRNVRVEEPMCWDRGRR